LNFKVIVLFAFQFKINLIVNKNGIFTYINSLALLGVFIEKIFIMPAMRNHLKQVSLSWKIYFLNVGLILKRAADFFATFFDDNTYGLLSD
jgi:hypothetical protein